MGFAENLRKKIEIEEKVRRILGQWGPPGSGRRIDKDIVKELLEEGGFRHEAVRDLDLYFLAEPHPDTPPRILVLDNEMPIFDSTAEDVAMRRSPTVKEMISIRNAVKILKDTDIRVSKREESLDRLRRLLIDELDLSFTEAAITQMANDGKQSLEKDYTEGVRDSLRLFAELLDFQAAHRAFQMANFDVYGRAEEGAAGEVRFGPMVLYGIIKNELRLVEEVIGSRSPADLEWLEQVAAGKEPASLEGGKVFDWMKEQVGKRHPNGILD
ncbi:MAG: hypothetical protein K9L59_19320 [Desulfobacterales bacterium]|nr:hypothetical protein [Desulfobacterales bacterium]